MRNDDELKYFDSPQFREILAEYEAMRESGHEGYMDADDLTDVADYYALVCEDEAQATEAINLALRLHPDALGPQLFLAKQYLRSNDLEHAEEVCDAISEQRDYNVVCLRAELMILRDHAHEAAEYILDIAEEVETEDLDYFYYDAAYIFIEYQNMAEALRIARVLESFAPDWYMTWDLLADVLLAEEQYTEAMPYIERMLDVEAFNTDSWNWCAEACCGIGNNERAMECVEYALAIEPENMRAMQLKAWLMLCSENPEEAHGLYEHLRQQQPEELENWLNDAQALLTLERASEASEVLMQVEEKVHESGSRENILVLHELLSMALSRIGNFQGAMAHIDKAEPWLTAPEDSADLFLMRARTCMENNLPGEARRYIDASMEADPSHATFNLYRGAGLYYEFYFEGLALPIFLEVASKLEDPQTAADCQAYIAACQDLLGEKKKALQTLRKAIEMKAGILEELFAERFPKGVSPEEYPYYYYYEIYGRWPKS